MNKLNQWLTLVANLSVVAGIVFLAVQMRQNTEAIQSQTRNAITEKEMEYLGWLATSPELAAAIDKAQTEGPDVLTGPERNQYVGWVGGQFREWENSQYQFERGLFDAGEYDSRKAHWQSQLSDFSDSDFYRGFWARGREQFAPSFRAEIDRIVAEVEQAQ